LIQWKIHLEHDPLKQKFPHKKEGESDLQDKFERESDLPDKFLTQFTESYAGSENDYNTDETLQLFQLVSFFLL